MKRRDFLGATALLPLARALPVRAADASASWRGFEISYEIDLKAAAGPAEIWLPLPQDLGDYQRALSVDWSGAPAGAGLQREGLYGAPLFHAAWRDGASVGPLRVSARVATRDRAVDLSRSAGRAAADPLASLYLRPTPSMPVDGIVGEQARQITGGIGDKLERVHAVYEWIVDNTFRDPKVLGCGTGDIVTMLETGNLGGKCADLNALFVGLVRAAGVPAREVYGIRVADSRRFKSLGKSGEISKAQHCRAEFHLERYGWVPADPADVRKAVLEEALPLADARIVALRRQLFGSWEMNWIGYNTARDFAPPGMAKPIPFLMYPNAVEAAGRNDGLRPDRFDYRITARESAA